MKINDKFYSSFNYDTYKNLRIFSYVGLWASILINFISLNDFALAFETLFGISNITLFLNRHNEYKAKDITEIRKLYDELINNYNNLNKMFDFKNPVEVYTLFTILYRKGYLSKDKMFIYGVENVKDIIPIMGANIFAGNGVCRHLSMMLCDVMNTYGFKTNFIPCYLGEPDLDIKRVNPLNFHLEETIEKLNILKRNSDSQELIDNIDKLITYLNDNTVYLNIEIIRKNPENRKVTKNGNHAICLSEHDGLSYFLDPTNRKIYDHDESKVFDSYGLLIDIKKTKGMKLPASYSPLDDIYKGSLSMEECEKMMSSVKELFRKNRDIFESFYQENEGIYSEVANKLVRIKSKN